jgi:hypothetical protein
LLPLDRQTIDISFLAMVEGGKNLAKVKVSNIDKKTVDQVATELDAGSQRLRKVRPPSLTHVPHAHTRSSLTVRWQGTDENFKKSMGPLKLLPTWLIRCVINRPYTALAHIGQVWLTFGRPTQARGEHRRLRCWCLGAFHPRLGYSLS